MFDYQKFKTSFKGFDKDEVLNYLESVESGHNLKISELEKKLRENEKTISDLRASASRKDEKMSRMEEEINSKYKKYIDNYDKIASLVYESQLKADQMIEDARAEADRILADAQAQAQDIISGSDEKVSAELNAAKAEADAQREAAKAEAAAEKAAARKEAAGTIEEGRMKYARIQNILNDTLNLVNETQKRFMSNYRDIHALIEAAPGSLRELDEKIGYRPENFAEEAVKTAEKDETASAEETAPEEAEGSLLISSSEDGEAAAAPKVEELSPEDEEILAQDDDDNDFETGELNFMMKKIVFDTDEEDEEIPLSFTEKKETAEAAPEEG